MDHSGYISCTSWRITLEFLDNALFSIDLPIYSLVTSILLVHVKCASFRKSSMQSCKEWTRYLSTRIIFTIYLRDFSSIAIGHVSHFAALHVLMYIMHSCISCSHITPNAITDRMKMITDCSARVCIATLSRGSTVLYRRLQSPLPM